MQARTSRRRKAALVEDLVTKINHHGDEDLVSRNLRAVQRAYCLLGGSNASLVQVFIAELAGSVDTAQWISYDLHSKTSEFSEQKKEKKRRRQVAFSDDF